MNVLFIIHGSGITYVGIASSINFEVFVVAKIFGNLNSGRGNQVELRMQSVGNVGLC